MEDKIKEAIEILIMNGYAVKKLSQQMIIDAEECDVSGCEKDCTECACSVCIIQ